MTLLCHEINHAVISPSALAQHLKRLYGFFLISLILRTNTSTALPFWFEINRFLVYFFPFQNLIFHRREHATEKSRKHTKTFLWNSNRANDGNWITSRPTALSLISDSLEAILAQFTGISWSIFSLPICALCTMIKWFLEFQNNNKKKV